jgi:multidrug efflux pump
MSLASLSLKRPVLAVVMSIMLVLFGIIGYQFLGVREYPAIDPPVVTVRTSYTGANADVIESQITEPLEKAINGIAGVKTISSSSNLGSSSITVEFNLNTEMEQAAADVRDKVAQAVRQLPQDIDGPPVIAKADASGDFLIIMPVQSRNRSLLELTDYASNVILERLQTIPGVSTVNVFGDKRYSMRIRLQPHKMAALGITASDIQNALNRENLELPGGKIAGTATELTVRNKGRLSDEKDFNQLILAQSNGKSILLSDVAVVELGAENEETAIKKNNIPAVGLAIVPLPGANHVEIADEFYRRLSQIKKELPKDIEVDVSIDKTRFVKQSLTEVKETLLIAFGLVVVIIFLFFRNWAIAFRPLIDIPVSLTGTFFIMYLMDFSINVLTLLGIVLATGLVVDDGIVVTENIFRKMEQGKDRETAAREGTDEIYFAVIATSLTLAVVFLPIVFLQGFVGSLFREFGIVVAGAVLISAFVSLSLTPVLNLKLAGNDTRRSRFYLATEPFFEALDQSYRNGLQAFLQQRWLAWMILLVCLMLIFFTGKMLPSELAPLEDRSLFRVQVTAPEGTGYDYFESYMDRVGQYFIDSVPDKRFVVSLIAPSFAGTGAVNSGFANLVLKLPSDRTRSQKQIAESVGMKLKKFPEGKLFLIQEQTISAGGTGRFGLPVQFVIQHLNFERLREKLPAFLEEANKSPVFQGVDVNLKFNKPELELSIDRMRAGELGVSVADVANTLQLCLSGRRMSYFIMNGKQYQVIAQLDRPDRDEPADLNQLFVRNRSGQLIRLDNLVKMQEVSAPPQIFHFNRFKSATVSAGLAPGRTLGDGVAEMKAIAGRVLDEDFLTDLSGASRDLAESSGNTKFAFILALVLIYLVLAAQFESFRDPVIIMITVPLAIAGAVFSLFMFGQSLNIFSQIGIIMLIGLVTKNGILIVEFANQKQEAGQSKTDAVLDAAAARLRPILMTSLATALGALPIALALGSGATSRISLGIVIVGGLLFSLVLTLFVIPAMYSFMAAKRSGHKSGVHASSI